MHDQIHSLMLIFLRDMTKHPNEAKSILVFLAASA